MQLLDEYDIDTTRIMTEKELKTIARFRGLNDPTAFDRAETFWPGQDKWRVQVIQVLSRLEQAEDDQSALEEAKRRHANAQKQRIVHERQAEHKTKAQETGDRMAKQNMNSKRPVLRTPSQSSTLTQLNPQGLFGDRGSSLLFLPPSTPVHDQTMRQRAVGTLHISPSTLR